MPTSPRVLAGVDDNDAIRVGSAIDQFRNRFRAGDTVAQHHDVVRELLLDTSHAPFLPAAFHDEIVSRPNEDEEHREPDRRDDHRLDQARPIADRGDIAKARGGDRDHGEIDHVEKADFAVEIVDQSLAVPPVDHHHDEDQEQRQPEPDAQVAPDRNLYRSPQRRMARAAIDPSGFGRCERIELLLVAHPTVFLTAGSDRQARPATNGGSGRAGVG